MGDIIDGLEIAKGRIPRFSSDIKYGVNPGVDAGPETLWQSGGLVVHPTVAAVATFVSDSTEDAAGLTGCRVLRVFGLDADWRPLVEDVVLTGTTPVLTTGVFIRVNRVRVINAGSLEGNAGLLTCTVGGVLVATLRPLTSSTLKAVLAVGRDQIVFIQGIFLSIRRATQTAGAQGTFSLVVRVFPDTSPITFVGAEVALSVEGNSAPTFPFIVPYVVKGPADIELRVLEVSDSATICNGSFSYILEDLVLPN